jgi:hypothetical protein
MTEEDYIKNRAISNVRLEITHEDIKKCEEELQRLKEAEAYWDMCVENYSGTYEEYDKSLLE